MNQFLKALMQTGLWLCICLLIFAGSVSAEETSGTISITQLDTATKKAVPGIRLTLYQIAVPDETSSSFRMSSAYAGLGIDVDTLGESKTAEQAVETLEKCIEENNIAGLLTVTTDEKGRAEFTGLSDGIYLVRQTNSEADFEALGYTFETDAYLIALPRTTEDGTAQTRTVSCQPKGKLTTTQSEPVDVTVHKVWKDNSDKYQARPSSITVGLYNGTTLVEEYTLSAVNNWTHTWENLDSQGDWDVKELSAPDGYSSKVTQEDMTFTITNTYNEPETPKTTTSKSGGSSSSSPKTGDETNLLIYLLGLAAGAAGVVIALLILRKKKSYR